MAEDPKKNVAELATPLEATLSPLAAGTTGQALPAASQARVAPKPRLGGN